MFLVPSTPVSRTPTSASQTQSTFVSSLSPTCWDVFLSFRGTDTRLNFTSHLYSALDRHGIRTFMDDPGLPSGEVIADALIQAIHQSKTYIIVFSENYATSPWCLNELVEILNCHQTAHRLIIPVFYKIDPSVVRYQSRSFEHAFKEHQVRVETEKLNKWRLTLKEVADLSGFHISHEKTTEADVINQIVDKILPNINSKDLYVAKYPVGLDSRVEVLTTLLNSDRKEGFTKIGLFGMGGIGKTTLAKALFNQLLRRESFKASCFLANVREVSGKIKGIESLQQTFINNVLKSTKKIEVNSVEEGIMLIKERICSAKVLLLIDDIDHSGQYESLVGSFASGSVVIITTRDQEILDKIEVEPKFQYMVNELDDAKSLALFTRHAFRNAEQKNTLMALSADILRLANGLPLALEVFGAYLFTQHSEVGWRSYIKKLQRDPDSAIQQKLIISLNAIEVDDPMLKKIFLDIACFFIGCGKEEVVKILATYYDFADHKIDILQKRCLLKINYNAYSQKPELDMHDLLRDMGREVVRDISSDEPGRQSRLWVSKHIDDVLKKRKGTEAIECIIPDNLFHRTETFETETFERMSKLRFLYLRNVNLTGSFEQIFEDLRWFCWHGCQLKCFPSEFNPQNLVILELPNSKYLTTTPDFTKLPSLETLDLHGCESLEEVDIPKGSLMRLVSLNVQGCENLRSLPNTICDLRALEVLDISECNSLEALPIQLGNIISLTKLNAEGLKVLKLPDSIGSLTKLVELNISNNATLETLPDTICNLRSLEILDISSCSSLKALPAAIGNIESLKKVRVSGLNVSKLPDSIGSLTKLVELNISNNATLETLPDTICNLRSLEILDITGCISLKALPAAIGNIESLKKIKARGVNVSKLPDSIGSLTKLVELYLSNNAMLETLPDTICNLRSLEILSINGCEKLEILPDELWKITRLRSLNAAGTTLLKKLPDIGSSEIALSLQKLDLSCSGITALPSGFSQLSNLPSLDISGCRNLLSIPKLPPNLKEIDASDCESVERLPNLSNLKHLETLELSYCSGLTGIQGLEELTALRELNLRDCSGLKYIEGLDKLSSIQTLSLGGCQALAYNSSKHLFQIYSEFGRKIEIEVERDPLWSDWLVESQYWTSELKQASDWITESPTSESTSESTTVYAHLLPNESHNFMGIILCFENTSKYNFEEFDCSVKNTASGFIWSDSLYPPWNSQLMVIVPKSIFSITDDDHIIEFTADNNSITIGIHLLYKTETKMIQDVFKNYVIDIDPLNLVDPVLQSIFLDIACFFIDWDKEEAVRILETFYSDVNHKIDILKNRCLLKINDRNKLEMNDLLQHIGRKIASNNAPNEPGKHSRLWLSIDIYDVLKKQKETKAIEVIIPRKPRYLRYQDALEGESFTTEAFKKMSDLRFLYLKNVNLTGSYERTLEDLRWLCWDKCPLECLPSDFYPPKLVILELPRSKLRTMWEPNMVSHVFDKLKTLNMSHSLDLTRTPDFIKLPYLEMLNFESCKSLKEVHISIGRLVRLSSLNLHNCVNLEILPDTISNLRMLRYLDIGGCTSLEAMPIGLGNCESLTELKSCGLSVSKLPDWMGHLSKLVELNLYCNMNLETLPDSICDLISLEVLDISGCKKLEVLPDQLWKLTRLRKLNAGGATKLIKLPNIESSQVALSLQRLDLSKTALTALPSGISQLTNLEDLVLTKCCRLFFIIELPTNLKWIKADGCTSMARIPNLCGLKQLEMLDLTTCTGLTEIQGFEEMASLTHLELGGCNSSFVTNTFTKLLFQMLCGFGHQIEIYIPSAEFPDWISQSSNLGSAMSLDVSPNLSDNILAAESMDSISQSSDSDSTVSSDLAFQKEVQWSSDLPPNVSHNFLGMILCFNYPVDEFEITEYSIKNITSDFILSGSLYNRHKTGSLMVIVPRSIFPVSDGDERVELTADWIIHGIYLLYKTELE